MLVDVNSLPTHKSRSLKIEADVVEIGDESSNTFHPCSGKILLFLSPADTIPSPGDRLLVNTSPSLPSAVENPHQFNYRKYLRRRGILYTAHVPASNYRILRHSDGGLLDCIASLRQSLIGIIQSSALSPEERGIAEALFLGWDDDLAPETEATFRAAGITHLLCVSGLHVGIVAMLVGYSLFFLSNKRNHRIIKGCIQLIVIWFFVILTGMAPGTMRAGIMFSLIIIGQMFFSRPPTLNSIAASALIILVINPMSLFEIGFQLSFCSVIAIVILVPRLQEIIHIPYGKNKITKTLFWILRRLRDLACVSIAAQIAISPFTLFYFHQFPLYFLVANIIIVPFAGLLLGSLLVMMLLAWWPWLFNMLETIVSAELSFTNWITSMVASWPHAVIDNIYFDLPMLFLTISVVVATAAALMRRKPAMLSLALALLLPLLIHCRMVEKRCLSQRVMTVYNVGNHTAIEYFAGHESYLLCDSIIANSPQIIDFQTQNNLVWHKARRTHILALDTTFNDSNLFIKNHFVGFAGKTMRIIDRSNYRRKSPPKIKLDYLLLRESPYITMAQLSERYDFDTLIIASQNSPRYRKNWHQQCDSLGINIMDYVL